MLGRSVVAVAVEGLGLLLALLFDALMAAYFGASADLDAFFVALTLPHLLLGAITANGMRTITPLLHISPESISDTLGGIISWAAVALIVAVAALATIAALLVPWLAVGFSADQQQTTVALLRLLLLSLIPLALSEPLRAFCVLRGRAGLATMSNALRYTGTLIVFGLLRNSLGIRSLAYALAVGSAFQALIYFVAAGWLGWQFRPNLSPSIARKLWQQFAPPTAGDLLAESGIVIERVLASLLPVGTVSAFGFARRILSALTALLTNAVLVVYTPSLTTPNSHTRTHIRRQVLQIGGASSAITLAVIITTPALLTFYLRNGQFDVNATTLTIQIVQIFALSLPLKTILFYLMLIHLAALKSRKLLEIGLLATASLILFDYLLFTQFGALGLALAQVISLPPVVYFAFRQTVPLSNV